MKISVFAYSLKGCHTARQIIGAFAGEEITALAPERIIDDLPREFRAIPHDSRSMYGTLFSESDAMIFVGACGIAVREIAPFVKSKKTDPAVLCVDERCTWVIPLLSGHIGRANALAGRLAAAIDAVPVITTATDINGRFSVDTWASANGYHISSMLSAKHVSARILEKDLPLSCEFPVADEYPPGTYPYTTPEEPRPDIGIYIGVRKEMPFGDTLRLVKKSVLLGIGCRRGTDSEDIEKAVNVFLSENNIDRHALKGAASIDLKKDEEGLLKWCAENDLPICFYTANELNRVTGDFEGSDFVKGITGTDNVCERAALCRADRVIAHKTAYGNVTLAAAVENTEVRFHWENCTLSASARVRMRK